MKSGNGHQKTCKTPRLAILTIILFFLKFSVAFVAGKGKALQLMDFSDNRVGNGIATSYATDWHFSERKLHLA